MLEELDKHSKAIRSSLGIIHRDFEKIAFNLYWIYSNKAYKALGYESIIDYALAEFDFSKSTTYNFINIVERFGERDSGGILTLDGIDKKYSGYSSSKLVLLSELEASEIEELGFTPEMSARDIKKKIKHARECHCDILVPPNPDNPPSLPEYGSSNEASDDFQSSSSYCLESLVGECPDYNLPVEFFMEEVSGGRVINRNFFSYFDIPYIYSILKHHPEIKLVLYSYSGCIIHKKGGE